MTSASILSNSWSVASPNAPWRFGRPWVGADQRDGVRWVLRRNCSVTPRQMLGFYLSMCVVSLGIASGFALHGAPVVLAFAGIELLVLGFALLVYARHATDADTLTLSGPSLAVEQSAGGDHPHHTLQDRMGDGRAVPRRRFARRTVGSGAACADWTIPSSGDARSAGTRTAVRPARRAPGARCTAARLTPGTIARHRIPIEP